MAPATMASAREVVLEAAPAPLAGTLTLPAHAGPVPGVLILGDAGPTDRDGNQPGWHSDSLRLLAAGLAACGVASLRADRRGVAGSARAALDEETLRFETLADDAVAWFARLRQQREIGRVALLGHGEGALVATLAARRVPADRLVLVAGAGRPAGQVLRAQLSTRLVASPALLRRADDTIARLERGETDEFPPPALAAMFRPGIQPFLISWFRIDPAAELTATAMPALVMQGTSDLQVETADARRLAAARPGVSLALFEGMNHVLRPASADWAENLASYARPEAPLMSGLVARICDFLVR
jgi:pimeloyl-ACP methyl ester carboxylesterase